MKKINFIKAREENKNYISLDSFTNTKEISYNVKIEDLNNMLNKYKKQQEEYTGQFFSEYHYSLSDRIGIVKSIIKFLEEMERNNEENI